ncbi:hypothetical protein Bcav_2462 [Beutenbergia cavernae DSM 12333]|uniref:Uncharacterized protein n=1 Tax=Beutenbergia cavernae (strain ATCC BAA-8 / DSM 12333 / CCUG 43141 / JCM 11478 / NBRC 16432 / NCIMB 13614 / HKI 0122) TaxID=471853 RepID=C5BWP6_BEUC1|nr:hypothetical protein [Beutenbergia cavernae]ACQ80712.1 hypothetical protein Bcav_2462 [Beutenbergia cavernae DSM 12333]
MSESRRYEIGHVENGHILGTDGQWHPLPDAPNAATATQTLPHPTDGGAPAAPVEPAMPTPDASPAKKRSGAGKVVAIVVGSIAALIVVIAAASSGGSTPDEAAAPPPAVENTEDAPAAEAPAEADSASDAEAPADPAPAPAELTNGQYIVGTTIEPGRYSMVVEDGAFAHGYVDQQDGDTYLAQETGGEAGATLIVDIVDVPGSIVEFSGVTQITLATDADPAAPAELSNGQYIVGTTIEPGRYTMVVEDGAFAFGYVDQQDGDNYLAQETGGEAGATIIVDVVDVPGSIVEFSGVTQITRLG